MLLYAYGETALTLCALSRNLDDILAALQDRSHPRDCRVFYRPSFGRKDGGDAPDMGAFDFILLTQRNLYLGESKWDKRFQVIRDGVVQLEPESLQRHKLFRFYLDQWAFGEYADWDAFRAGARPPVDKPVPATGSRLAENLQTVLGIIRDHYAAPPAVRDVLLFFHHQCGSMPVSLEASHGFEIVCVDCSAASKDNYIAIEM